MNLNVCYYMNMYRIINSRDGVSMQSINAANLVIAMFSAPLAPYVLVP